MATPLMRRSLGAGSVFFGAGPVGTGSTQFRQMGQLIPMINTLRVEEATLLAFALNSRIRTTPRDVDVQFAFDLTQSSRARRRHLSQHRCCCCERASPVCSEFV